MDTTAKREAHILLKEPSTHNYIHQPVALGNIILSMCSVNTASTQRL